MNPASKLPSALNKVDAEVVFCLSGSLKIVTGASSAANPLPHVRPRGAPSLPSY
jgi:hypothetical protein